MRIAITGGSGSLGTALLHRLAQHGADRVVVFSRDEQKRNRMTREYAWHPGVKVYAGDVREQDRLIDLFHGCDVVVHAAARKVVSGHHDEPREMLETNVLGTLNVISAARKADVRKVLFISSDKAVRSENTYGMSKALAEQLVISENARCWPRGQRMSVIRYGNVIGSNGSVLRIWRDKHDAGDPLPISDARMTRFWLTVDMACEFIMKALADMRGGEIFVPKLMKSPILSLARAVVPPDEEMTTVDMGIRPGGEKLHEELVSADEARRTVSRGAFYIVKPTEGMDSWDLSPWLGEQVPESFEYRSDTWPHEYSVEDLREMLRTGKRPERQVAAV